MRGGCGVCPVVAREVKWAEHAGRGLLASTLLRAHGANLQQRVLCTQQQRELRCALRAADLLHLAAPIFWVWLHML